MRADQSSAKFLGKMYLIHDGNDDFIGRLIVFHNELDPVESTKLSDVEEWVADHIQNAYYPATVFRELLGLPKDENSYHVLFTGTITGYKLWSMDGDEYDEEMEIDDGVKFAVICPEIVQYFFPPLNEIVKS